MAEKLLSLVRPDVEDVANQLTSLLLQKDSWKDLSRSSTGSLIIDFISVGIATKQFSIERGAQETMLDTARLDSSIYAINRMLGVRIKRKIPSQVSVSLIRENSSLNYTIPKHSQFTIDNNLFFNREAIVFPVNITSLNDIILYQGEIKSKTLSSTGSLYQKIYIGDFNEDLIISDEDVYCVINSTEDYLKTRSPLWELVSTDLKFFESTLPNGEVEILFGNGIYGKSPVLGDSIVVTWAETLGTRANNSTTGLVVEVEASSEITGTTTSSIDAGGDKIDIEFYRRYGPYLHTSKEQAILKNEYQAVALTYPNIKDCIIRGQAETFPADKNFMNVLSTTLLTETPFTTPQWNSFVEFMNEKSMYSMHFLRVDPTSITVSFNIDIYCFSGVSLNDIRERSIELINTLFSKRFGILGKSRYRSDIDLYLKDKLGTKVVDFIVNSFMDTQVLATQYLTLGTLNVNAFYTTR